MSDQELVAWELQPGEPYEWFQRFDLYRQMPGKRNILRLYREERKRDAEREPNEKSRARKLRGAETVRAAPRSYYQMRDKWRWDERVQAYDDHLREEKKRTEAEDREKARGARHLMVKAMHTLLVNAVKAHQTITDPKELRELAQAAALIMKESRLEFGESTEIVASSVTATTTSNVNVKVNDYDTAAGILEILARAGAIQSGAAAGDNTETE